MREEPTIKEKPKLKIWKKVLIGLGIVVVLVLAYFFLLFKALIEIRVEPENALLEIDNHQHSIGMNKVKPGNREIKISAPGYETYQKGMAIKYFSNQPLFVELKEIPVFKQLDQGSISFLDYNSAKNSLYYIKNQAAYRINLNQENSNPEKISGDFFKNLKYLVWAKDNEGVVARLGSKTFYYDFKRYDLLRQAAKFWSSQIGSFALAPDRQRIAFFQSPSGQEQSLILSNTQRSSINRVARLEKFSNPFISWLPNRQYILILEEHRIELYDTYSDQLEEVATGGSYQNGVVAPDSVQILYATPNPAGDPALSLMDIKGQEKKNLNLNAYLKNIDWLDQESFCGVGQQESEPLLFCYNTSKEPEEAVTELSWQEPEGASFKGLVVSQENQEIYLIKSNLLVSLSMTEKGY